MRVPRTIHLLGHDWRVEFVPPEKLAAVIRETSPMEPGDGYYVAYWNIQHRTIWIDGTIPPNMMLEAILHETSEIIAHELGFERVSPADDDGHKELGLLCRFLASVILENQWLAEWPAEIYGEAHGDTTQN